MGSTKTAAEMLSHSDMQILTNRGYCLTEVVGEGSYAKVYLCKKSDGNKVHPLACKVIDTKQAPPNFVKKFLTREIEILTKISHPHIIHLFSMLHKGSRFFIFMRLAEKGDLLEFILKKNHVGETRARTWTAQLSSALEYLHVMGIVHRDIKTENVLISASYNAKLSDFGFARTIIDNGSEIMCQTHCGSMPYTAPEVLKGRKLVFKWEALKDIFNNRAKRYDARKSDMWSLGVVAYVMINKRLPFSGSASQEVMVQKQMERKVSFEGKEASAQYRHAVMSLLEPDVDKRWSAPQLLNSSWIRMDEKLTVRSEYEKDALEKAFLYREKILYDDKHHEVKEPKLHSFETEKMKILHRPGRADAGSSGLIKNDKNREDPGLAVIRQEVQSSYTSVWHDKERQKESRSASPFFPRDFDLGGMLRAAGKRKAQAMNSKTHKK